MKKEEILAGVRFMYKGVIYTFESAVYNGSLFICHNDGHYANIGEMRDEFMVVYSTFFSTSIEAQVYYKDLIKVA